MKCHSATGTEIDDAQLQLHFPSSVWSATRIYRHLLLQLMHVSQARLLATVPFNNCPTTVAAFPKEPGVLPFGQSTDIPRDPHALFLGAHANHLTIGPLHVRSGSARLHVLAKCILKN